VTLFRDKNLSRAREDLDVLQEKYERNDPLDSGKGFRRNNITADEFIEAKNLYIELCKQDDFKLRISIPYMQIYSHDYDWLTVLSYKIKSTHEFWEPKLGDLHKLNKNIIIVNNPVEYTYKVTLGQSCDKNLAAWIRNNPNKAKAGNICLNTIEHSGYVRGLYFYARDEKIVQLLNLFVTKLARIDKLVYNTNIDK
tara:strand:- start:148 stop:735 length:588 start_codon:yes stop_codon:yes gene_type:complete